MEPIIKKITLSDTIQVCLVDQIRRFIIENPEAAIKFVEFKKFNKATYTFESILTYEDLTNLRPH